MADSDFVTGMIVGGSGRGAASWEASANQWRRAATAHEKEALERSGMFFAAFDVLTSLPREARAEILGAMRTNLQAAMRTRFGKRGLTEMDADARSVEFLKELEAAWGPAPAAPKAAKPRL